MTEAEAMVALAELTDIATAQTSVWLSLTFTYLTVAYLAGKKLSRFQCLAIPALYTVTAGFFGSAMMLHSQA